MKKDFERIDDLERRFTELEGRVLDLYTKVYVQFKILKESLDDAVAIIKELNKEDHDEVD